MAAVSKAQQRFMGMVHAAQKGEKPASADVAKVAKTIGDKDAEDFASTKHKGLPDRVSEIIRKMVREIMTQRTLEEMNVTGNVAGYQTPYAFTSKGGEKKKAKRQADLTGYSVVNEDIELDKEILAKIHNVPKGAKKVSFKKEKSGYTVKYDDPKTGVQNTGFLSNARINNYLHGKLKETISENRWLELRNEVTPPHAKIGKGISNINKQLAEMERFLNWYGRIKQESGITNDQFWKRTNHNIYKIKERLIKLEQQVRKISQ